ncbi:MAG: hypothetical protein J2P46_11920 [Zavarzinella sp.]|nr:hypothetical protein [Zavarzinella sp.]
MSRTQRFFKAILPRKWFAAAEAESRAWMMRCPCGAEQSVWDMGGIRWKATGRLRQRAYCDTCGQATSHTLTRISPTTG